ncbi:MAG TPA: helix-turn-helix transcriptional regulator [Casimicrobiaceae bacterium]|nr:helix-turn-helix transcriptional regulator [Casimicrobiaceae bacterium]
MARALPHDTLVPAVPAEMMDTREVAAYLRLKERRIYDLVRQRAIPHVRATGKLLFPRAQIDAWIAGKGEAPAAMPPRGARAPIIAGSHDPLLEWAARESRCGLAILAGGSRAGVEALARGEATAAATHWLDDASGEYNVPLVRELFSGADVVVLEWARRTQGLLLGEGNPHRIRKLADLARKRVRIASRQPGAGSHRLLLHLLAQAGIRTDALDWSPRITHAETELAAIVRNGQADVGLGIEAAARANGLAFVPLATERFDLVTFRRDAFEPPLQALLACTRTPEFAATAASLRGYDVTLTGRVVFNA